MAAYLAQCLRMALHLPQRRLVAQPQQAMAHPHEMLANDGQAGFRQQEVDIGHPAMQAVFNRNHRHAGAAGLHGFYGIFKAGAGQGQPIRERFPHRLVAVSTGRPLKRHGLFRRRGRCRRHAINQYLGQVRIAARHVRSL